MEENEKPANNDFAINNLIKQRWSPRMFSEKKITEEDLNKLFEAARWAASSSNFQPWRFMYSHKGSEFYNKMFECLSDYNKQWVSNAPLLIFGAFKKRFDNGKENFHALHDLGLSMGNFSLQAQELGIALHQMAGVDWQKAHEMFDVSDEFHIATAIAVGYYGGDKNELPEKLLESENKKRERKKQEEFVFKDNWINK